MIERIGLIIFFSALTMLLSVCVLVKMENRSMVRILKRLGVDIYLRDMQKYFKILQSINNDAIAFIDMEGVCQCPVMVGDYSNKSLNRRFSSVGELYILENNLSKAFKSFSKDKDVTNVVLADLTVIKGSLRNKNCTSMGAKFSLMRQYVHTLKTNNPKTFDILEGNIRRKYRIISGVDLLIEDLPSFSCKSRSELIENLRSNAYYNYTGKVDLENNILVFMSATDIDVHIVLVVEV